MNTTFTKTFSIKDVYKTDTPEIPKGYKALDFRPPKSGEFYLNHLMGPTKSFCPPGDYQMFPWIILTKLPDPVVIKGNVEYEVKSTVSNIYGKEEIPIPEGYEFLDFRPPNEGEYFIPFFAPVRGDRAIDNWERRNSNNARIILRKVTP